LPTTAPLRRRRLAAATTALAALGLSVGAGLSLAPTATATPPGGKDVTATLFEWKFDSVAKACTDTLGPKGYGYVEVSPPQEHIQGAQWWTSYQPVSYKIAGRLGDRASFQNMVSTCHAAGVKVVADAVVNHMTAGSGTGTGGTTTPSTTTRATTRTRTSTPAGRRSATTATAPTCRTANWSAWPTWTPAPATCSRPSPTT
jgi:alpha-amylase